MATQQRPLPGDLVKKSNAIARARWQPESIWESRIVALVASKVRESDEDFQTYRIPVAELAGGADESLSGFQYQEIRKSILHLAKATIVIEGDKPRNFMSYPIFSACGYEDGCLVARFDPELKPHFLNLKEKFTAYNLFEYLNLPSAYSQKIFEFLKSWANAPEVVVSVVELHELLNTPESFRKDFRQLRVHVLEKAHKDIQAHTSLRYEWELAKAGRPIKSIRFLFAPGRKAMAELEQGKAREEKRKRVEGQRLNRALDCAKEKKGECATQDNKPIVCKMCLRFKVCEDLRRQGG